VVLSCGVHYRVHSKKVECGQWYPTKTEAIAAFERASKRAGIEPSHDYPPDVSGDCFTDNHIDYPHWAAWVRDGHGWV
jgi:hypothetical protein